MDDLEALMPNHARPRAALADASPANTEGLREYMQATGKPPAFPALAADKGEASSRHVRREAAGLRAGTGRVPRAKRFSICVRGDDAAAWEAAAGAAPGGGRDRSLAAALDPEELKEALLGHARAQRQELLAHTLRGGSGRLPPRRPFRIVLRPVVVSAALRLDDDAAAAAAAAQAPEAPGTAGPAAATAGGAGRAPWTPTEGIPERQGLAPAAAPWRPGAHLAALSGGVAAGATGVGSSRAPGAGSPIAGVVAHAAAAAEAAPRPADAPAGEQPAAAPAGDDDYDGGGGFDDGGGWDDGGWDAPGADDGAGGSWEAAPAPRAAAPPKPRAPRRPVLNPGARLRAELPRKSLAVHPNVGRREVAPGVRRSTRAPREPLRWWLGEAQRYSRREHRTMPTIVATDTRVPNTPWRTVADPTGLRRGGVPRAHAGQGKRRAAAAASDTEEEDEEGPAEEEAAEGADDDAPAPRALRLSGSPADAGLVVIDEDGDGGAESDAETVALGGSPAPAAAGDDEVEIVAAPPAAGGDDLDGEELLVEDASEGGAPSPPGAASPARRARRKRGRN